MRDGDLNLTDELRRGLGLREAIDTPYDAMQADREGAVSGRKNMALSIVLGVLEARRDERRIEMLARADGLRQLRRAHKATVVRGAAASGLIHRIMAVPGAGIG
jgi:hypothetical protein